jgi:dUTP pyrophosphatase
MHKIDLKFKRLVENAIPPVKAGECAAGFDLTAIDVHVAVAGDNTPVLIYKTGIAVEIPEGHVGLLFPKNSIAEKSLSMPNAVGLVDSDYRGELIAKFKVNCGNAIPNLYHPNEPFAQLVIMPYTMCNLVEVPELPESEQGELLLNVDNSGGDVQGQEVL